MTDPLCIVCPHPREQHYHREETDTGCWCKSCNSVEMVGPCSYYFMARHPYEPASPEHRGPHNAIDGCRYCGLSVGSEAHTLTEAAA